HGPLAALLDAARVARARLARAREVATPLRLDAGALSDPSDGLERGLAVLELDRPTPQAPGPGLHAAVAAHVDADRDTAPGQLDPGGHLVTGLVAAHARVDGAAPLGVRCRAPVELDRVERLIERVGPHLLHVGADANRDLPAHPAASSSGATCSQRVI